MSNEVLDRKTQVAAFKQFEGKDVAVRGIVGTCKVLEVIEVSPFKTLVRVQPPDEMDHQGKKVKVPKKTLRPREIPCMREYLDGTPGVPVVATEAGAKEITKKKK